MKQEIRKLLKERNAILLAHNYQPPEIQDIADLCGDSLELSIKASKTTAEVIVFCGVHFMAETASILSPHKTVLLPRIDAGCPMADMVTPELLQKRMQQLPHVPVVTYVNSSAAVKALTTICCTSANVVQVVNSLDSKEILMVPDRNLAQFAAAHTDKTIHFWEGYCPIHDRLTVEAVRQTQNRYPNAIFMAHPECRPEVTALAQVVTSTSGMLRYAKESSHQEFIVGTEIGLLYSLKRDNPEKKFYPASASMVCENMKKITLTDVIRSIENMEGIVTVPDHIRKPAYLAVERMINLAKSQTTTD